MCAYNTIPPPVSRPDFKFSHFCFILYSLERPVLDTSRFEVGEAKENPPVLPSDLKFCGGERAKSSATLNVRKTAKTEL